VPQAVEQSGAMRCRTRFLRRPRPRPAPARGAFSTICPESRGLLACCRGRGQWGRRRSDTCPRSGAHGGRKMGKRG